MNIYKHPLVIFLIVYTLFVMGYWAWLWTLPSHTTVWNFWINSITGVVFTVGGVYGIVKSMRLGLGSTIGKGLLLIGLGLFSWGIGLHTWLLYNLVFHIDVPYPSFVDLFLLAFYPLVGLGVLFLIKLYRPSVTSRIIAESIAITIVSIVAILYFLRPDLSGNLPDLIRILNVAYPVGTAILFALAFIILRIGGGSIHKGLPLFVIGLLLHAIGSYLFGYENTIGTYWNGANVEEIVMLGGVFMTISLVKIVDELQAPQVKK